MHTLVGFGAAALAFATVSPKVCLSTLMPFKQHKTCPDVLTLHEGLTEGLTDMLQSHFSEKGFKKTEIF